jgi:Phage portal protein, SPP1 Gp6-like
LNQDDDRTALYLPDRIVRLRANQTGPTTQGFATVEEQTNPLGTAPVVNLRNPDRIVDDFGSSEINDLKPLGDALNKSLADMMVTSEYVGWPRRWATSIALTEEPIIGEDGRPTIEVVEVNPIPEGARAMISQSEVRAARRRRPGWLRGQRARDPWADHGRVHAARARRSFTDNPASADALRAAEASLTVRAEARHATFGRAWEQFAKLTIAVRDGRNPNLIDDTRLLWADAATRNVAQHADAVVKLYQAGLLSTPHAEQARLLRRGDWRDSFRTCARQRRKHNRLHPIGVLTNPIGDTKSDTETADAAEAATVLATEDDDAPAEVVEPTGHPRRGQRPGGHFPRVLRREVAR